MSRFIASLTLVVLAALLQLTSYALVAHVKPDFTLVLVIFLSFIYKDWLKRAVLIFLAAFILKFGKGIELENILFILSSFIGIFIIEKFPSVRVVNLFAAVILTTFLMNLAHFNLPTALTEMLYNIFISLSYFGIYKLWQGKYGRNQ